MTGPQTHDLTTQGEHANHLTANVVSINIYNLGVLYDLSLVMLIVCTLWSIKYWYTVYKKKDFFWL